MLNIDNLSVSYGSVNAVRGVSFSVASGETVALLGPNGAGKTSIISAIVGLVPSKGTINFDRKMISSIQTEDRIRMGMTVVPEGRHVFANLTVGENMTLGAAIRHDKQKIKMDLERFMALFPRLEERFNQVAGTLSGGEQQMLAIARALMAKPRFLMLDEPSLGLAPRIIEDIFKHISALKEQSITLLIVEQNVTQALKIADRAYVLSSGELIMEGSADNLATDKSLIKAYLGGGK